MHATLAKGRLLFFKHFVTARIGLKGERSLELAARGHAV
jgi:hypothetical protein